MSFFVSDQLKGHISETDLLLSHEEDKCKLILNINNHCIDVKIVQFQDESDKITCIIKDKVDITALLKNSTSVNLCFDGVKIRTWQGKKAIQSIYKEGVSKMLFCDIIIKNESRG
jgi:hypothetical protein